MSPIDAGWVTKMEAYGVLEPLDAIDVGREVHGDLLDLADGARYEDNQARGENHDQGEDDQHRGGPDIRRARLAAIAALQPPTGH